MINYLDENYNFGYIPEKCDIKNITTQIIQNIPCNITFNYFVAIPEAANYLLDNICTCHGILINKKYINKSNWNNELSTLLEKNQIILIDDIICHGQTVKSILNKVPNINNIKLIIIYFHIVSYNICLYDIEENKFTLNANNKLYYLYFIKEKFLLRIPTIIYATYNYILMKSDVEKYGDKFEYFLNGISVSKEEVLKLL